MALNIPPQNVPPLIMTGDSADGVTAGDLDRFRLWDKNWYLFLQQVADSIGGSTPTPPTPPVTGEVLSVDLKLTAATDLNGIIPGVAHGDLLVVRLEQDSTGGWAVIWPSYVTRTPPLPTTASTVCLMCFVGTAMGTWDLCGVPVLGVTPTSAHTIPVRSPGFVQTVDQLVTSNTTANLPALLIPGNICILRILQDGTGGWTVSYPSNARYAPSVPTAANTSSIMVFFGAVTNRWELCALPVLGRLATSGSVPVVNNEVVLLEITASSDITVTAPTFGPPLLIVRLTQDNIGGWAVTMGAGFSPLPVWAGGANEVRTIMFLGASSGLWETCAQLV